jgi:hypothetical protein
LFSLAAFAENSGKKMDRATFAKSLWDSTLSMEILGVGGMMIRGRFESVEEKNLGEATYITRCAA